MEMAHLRHHHWASMLFQSCPSLVGHIAESLQEFEDVPTCIYLDVGGARQDFEGERLMRAIGVLEWRTCLDQN